MLDEVKDRISRRGITVSFSDEVTSLLAKEGFDPVYGARPLRRAIVRRVEDGLSEEILSGRIGEGDTVAAELRDGSIVYEKADAAKTE